MTKTQVNNILSDLGYSTNTFIKADKIAIISTDLDGPVYSGENTRFLFNTSTENLEIYYGQTKNGEFVYEGNIPSFVIPFANVYGITLAGPLHRQEPYKTGQAV